MKRRRGLRSRGNRYERDKEFVAEFRRQVLERDKFTCQYPGCGRNWVNCSMAIDAHHRKPRSRGGGHDPQNGVALCREHHSRVHDHSLPDWRDWVD